MHETSRATNAVIHSIKWIFTIIMYVTMADQEYMALDKNGG